MVRCGSGGAARPEVGSPVVRRPGAFPRRVPPAGTRSICTKCERAEGVMASDHAGPASCPPTSGGVRLWQLGGVRTLDSKGRDVQGDPRARAGRSGTAGTERCRTGPGRAPAGDRTTAAGGRAAVGQRPDGGRKRHAPRRSENPRPLRQGGCRTFRSTCIRTWRMHEKNFAGYFSREVRAKADIRPPKNGVWRPPCPAGGRCRGEEGGADRRGRWGMSTLSEPRIVPFVLRCP